MNNNYYVKQGDKILNSFSFFSDKEGKLDKAMEFYKKAFTEFIEKQDFLNYSILSEKVGDEFYNIGDMCNATTHYKNAQKYYLNSNIDKYINLTLSKMIPLYIQKNQIDEIGISYYKLANLIKDSLDHEQTIDYFQKAISYLETENNYNLRKCYIDFTHFLLDYGDIDSAMHYIELIIERSINLTTITYIELEYIFLYLLCAMSKNDIVLVNKKINEYCNLVHKFEDSPKHILIKKLNEACENNDIDNFTNYVYEYDKIYKLKPHEVKLLLNIKNNIKENNDVDIT